MCIVKTDGVAAEFGSFEIFVDFFDFNTGVLDFYGLVLYIFRILFFEDWKTIQPCCRKYKALCRIFFAKKFISALAK